MPGEASLLDYAAELRDAMNAAGLVARIVVDPDTGAGVVIEAPELDYPDRPPRVGCQDLATAHVTAEITVVGSGWAPEQVEALLSDATTAFYAVPAPWRPLSAAGEASPAAPLYRITCQRN